MKKTINEKLGDLLDLVVDDLTKLFEDEAAMAGDRSYVINLLKMFDYQPTAEKSESIQKLEAKLAKSRAEAADASKPTGSDGGLV